MKQRVAKYWLTAARAGFVQQDAWQHWADERILSMPNPPTWILSMSSAADVEDLRKVVAEAFAREQEVTIESSDDPLIGYLWWKHENGAMPLHECLRLAGEAADAGDSTVSCESIYELLNRLESGGESEETIEMLAKELLMPLREVAEKQWDAIQTDC